MNMTLTPNEVRELNTYIYQLHGLIDRPRQPGKMLMIKGNVRFLELAWRELLAKMEKAQ